jgi:hypothetical protein
MQSFVFVTYFSLDLHIQSEKAGIVYFYLRPVYLEEYVSVFSRFFHKMKEQLSLEFI